MKPTQTQLKTLGQSPLFAGIQPADIQTMLTCLAAKQKALRKKEILYRAGETGFQMGVALSGSLDILQEDFWGNAGILARLAPGDIFAESFVLSGVKLLPVSIVAESAASVVLLGNPLHTCQRPCPFHTQLITNLLFIAAQKNITLTDK